MALFGSNRDIALFKSVNKEIIQNIIEQQVGYYKIVLKDSQPNTYGESINKIFNNPVLVYCLINHQGFSSFNASGVINVDRKLEVSFLKQHLIDVNVLPERGDIIVWNDDYYELRELNENQFISGKLPEHNYGESYLEGFGESFSINTVFTYVSPETLNLGVERI